MPKTRCQYSMRCKSLDRVHFQKPAHCRATFKARNSRSHTGSHQKGAHGRQHKRGSTEKRWQAATRHVCRTPLKTWEPHCEHHMHAQCGERLTDVSTLNSTPRHWQVVPGNHLPGTACMAKPEHSSPWPVPWAALQSAGERPSCPRGAQC